LERYFSAVELSSKARNYLERMEANPYYSASRREQK